MTNSDKVLYLNQEELSAVKWLNSMSDTVDVKTFLNLSAIPFDWNDDSLLVNQHQAKIQFSDSKYLNVSIIDSVFSTDKTLKLIDHNTFKKTVVVEIWYYPRNNMRTHSILIAVDKSKRKKIIGFRLQGRLTQSAQ